jgi:hypothetical protein
VSGLPVAGGRRHPALLRISHSLFLEKEKGLVVVQDEVAPVEAMSRLVRGRVLVGDT